jgi:23S rRNA (uracil1939-C5)-methyltransferase
MPVVHIESLDHEGRGATHLEGKAIFVEGALPGECVDCEIQKRRPTYEQARITRIMAPCAQRVAPRCASFGVCGGCSLQHMDPLAQAAAKQRVLEDIFWEVARLRPETVYPLIEGPAWGYRDRARLSVRLVPKKGGVLVGFHERRSSYVADMSSCEVLPPAISALLVPLRALVENLSIPDRIAQIEVAIGENDRILVFRHLLPFTPHDIMALDAFGKAHAVSIWLQPKGPDSIHPLSPHSPRELFYTLPEFDVRIFFRPTDFTQVNVGINRMLVRRALQLLAPKAGERIADLFCGLGNFTLPIARSGAHLIGIEGSPVLVDRAKQNAQRNGLESVCDFFAANLFEATQDSLHALGPLDKCLIDPPREGAIALVKAIDPEKGPHRIVYVSCNPATLARDAAVLVHEKGYRLRGAGIANMFPQTLHVESIALFEKAT